MLQDATLTNFTAALASSAPTPGGGGAAALIGAIGISLGDMVGELTVGKKRYADVEAEVAALMARAQALRERFLELIDADAAAFEPLAKAYSIPKDDPSRADTMEAALRVACSAPMDIMEACGEALDIIAEFAAKGSKLAISDAGCGAVACKAAIQAASLNVRINTKLMRDRDHAEQLDSQMQALLDKYEPIADEIYQLVIGRM